MLRFAIVAVLLVQAVTAVDETENFIGWHDFFLKVKDQSQADVVREFSKNNDCMIPRVDNNDYPQDVLVRAEDVESFKELLTDKKIEFVIAETDMGARLLETKLENEFAASQRNSDPTNYYAKTDVIYKWIRELASKDKALEVENYGTSYEKRELLVLKLSTNKAANKPIIFLDATIHAREWLSTATLCWIIKRMLSDKNNEVVQKYDWYFVPVANPDGYEYTHRSFYTRYWRKTRKPYGRNYGADPNRNFDYKFGGPGTSNNPSSDIYHGPHPFSEPETKALSEYLRKYKNRVAEGMYFNIHTYGQLWLTPPGYTRVEPSDHKEMMRVANAGANALKGVHGRSWKVGQPANIGLYEAAGGSYDWVKFVLGVKYSYVFELFPKWPAGLNGFSPNKSAIKPSGEEVYAALQATVKARSSA